MNKAMLLVFSMLAAGLAQAAVPSAVTDAITQAGTDVVTLGSLVFVVAIGISVFLWMRKAAGVGTSSGSSNQYPAVMTRRGSTIYRA